MSLLLVVLLAGSAGAARAAAVASAGATTVAAHGKQVGVRTVGAAGGAHTVSFDDLLATSGR